MNGNKDLICKNKEEYDSYTDRKDIYEPKSDWNVNLQALAKYIEDNHLKAGDVTEEIINKFKIE